jgi:hypothetical protein
MLDLVVVLEVDEVVCFTVAGDGWTFADCELEGAGATPVLLVLVVVVELGCLVVPAEGWTLAVCPVPVSFFTPNSAGFNDGLGSVVVLVEVVVLVVEVVAGFFCCSACMNSVTPCFCGFTSGKLGLYAALAAS